MSGTSADGIDAVAAEIGDERPRPHVQVLAHAHHDYPDPLRAQLLAAAEGIPLTASDLARLHVRVGEEHAAAAQTLLARSRLERDAIAGVAMHGQTVAHLPDEWPRATLQIGDAARVAEAVRRPVLADFRSADVAAGGEGAPLVPFADWVVFAEEGRGRAVQNVGGIANLTYLAPDARAASVVAFDTGPGNMVVDAIVARLTGGRERLDRDGARAARGRVDEELVQRALSHPYFAEAPPKSTGRESFGTAFVDDLVGAAEHLPEDDLVATATAITARSVADAYRRFLLPRGRVDEVVVAGGGARNGALMAMLRAALGEVPVRPSDELGVPAEAREALAFAVLGAFALRGETNTLPQCTGAQRAVVAGAVWTP